MKEQTPVKNYRLSVRDFGPIVEADVELRPLTVLVGPSNTGKSYLATLIYVINLVLEHGSIFRSRLFSHGRASPRQNYLSDWLLTTTRKPEDDDEIYRTLGKWLEHKETTRAVSESQAPYIPDALKQLIIKKLHESSEWGDFFAGEMKRCFGVTDLDRLVRKSAKSGADIKINLSPNGESAHLDLAIQNNQVAFSSAALDSTLSIHPEQWEKLAVLLTQKEMFISNDYDRGLHNLLVNFLVISLSNLIEPVIKDEGIAFYLPAGRTGVMHGHQALVGALIQSATMVGLRPSPDVQILPGVLGDFLQQIINIGQVQDDPRDGPRGRRASLPKNGWADRMEKEILEGGIEIVRSLAGYPMFRYKPAGWKESLPLSRASSMVSELAPVVLYLRYMVLPGDVLIIEEPESHLHPALQTAFARQLARLAGSGVRVIVTTHSEWLLEQFANLVRVSELPEDQRAPFCDPDEVLGPGQFGAWRFRQKQRPKGSVVDELTIDPIAGGLLADYDDITMGLYNEWASIGNQIESGKSIKKGKKR